MIKVRFVEMLTPDKSKYAAQATNAVCAAGFCTGNLKYQRLTQNQTTRDEQIGETADNRQVKSLDGEGVHRACAAHRCLVFR